MGNEKNRAKRMKEYLSGSADDTESIGRDLGALLPCGSILCFFGGLGAGKTTFIKGIASGFAGIDPREVNSPTFTYLNIYGEQKKIYHFDLYRMRTEDDFVSMGFEEFFFSEGLCCIEWSERITSILPAESIRINMHYQGASGRLIIISK